MSVVTGYPGKYPHAIHSLAHEKTRTLEKSNRLQATRTTKNVHKSAGRIYIITCVAFYNKKIKDCKLFHSYYNLLATEHTLT